MVLAFFSNSLAYGLDLIICDRQLFSPPVLPGGYSVLFIVPS